MLPSVIDPAAFGAPTFDERWTDFTCSESGRTPTRWRTVAGAGGPAKPEYRCGSRDIVYVDPTFPGVQGGAVLSEPLGIEAVKINPGSYAALLAKPTPPDLKALCHDRPWTGALLTTKLSFSQLFGYFECKANLPIVKGMWPGFWMMPVKGQWPANGEIDVMEALGVDREIYCSVHSSDGPSHRTVKVSLPFPTGGSGVAHTYGVAWNATELVWYVDRKEVCRMPTPADMKSVPMYLLLDLGVGGVWAGMPDNPKASAIFLVQRVTAWQLF